MSRTAVLLPLFLAAAACAHSPASPLFELPAPRALAGPTLARQDSDGVAPSAYEIRFELRRFGAERATPDREQLELPVLCAPVGGTANVVVTNQMSYVSGVDVVFAYGTWMADPEIDVLGDGLEISVATAASPEPGTSVFAFRLRTSVADRPLAERAIEVSDDASTVTLQLPRSDVREVVGVGAQPFGEARLVAHVPGTTRDSQLALFATVYAVALDPAPDLRVFLGEEAQIAPPTEDLELLELLGRARSAPPVEGTLRLCLVHGDSLQRLTPLPDATVGVRTRLTAGVSLSARSESSYVADRRVRRLHEGGEWTQAWRPVIESERAGLDVRVLDGGRLLVTFKEPVRWRDATVETAAGSFVVQRPDATELRTTVTLRAGDQLVPLGADRDGRAVSVLVRYEPE